MSGREVTVWREESIYRARVEPATKGVFRKRDGWQYVIERAWSRLGPYMMHAEDWKVCHRGPWCETRADAEAGGSAWLDTAEARNPTSEDYLS